MRQYHVYILASSSRDLYIGVTNDIVRRVGLHRAGKSYYTWKNRIHRLVYSETTTNVYAAITREKQLKRWTRARKIELITSLNPAWGDFAEGWPTLDY